MFKHHGAYGRSLLNLAYNSWDDKTDEATFFYFWDGGHDKTNCAGENPFEHGVAWTYWPTHNRLNHISVEPTPLCKSTFLLGSQPLLLKSQTMISSDDGHLSKHDTWFDSHAKKLHTGITEGLSCDRK